LTAEGFEDKRGALQSKKGRQQGLDTLNQCENGLEAQTLLETIDHLAASVKEIEKRLQQF
jgi:hypothetical protein